MDPAAFLSSAKLQARKGTSPEEGWVVKTEEHHMHRLRPQLINVVDVAGPSMERPRWSRLSEIPDPVETEFDAELVEGARRLRARAEESDDLVHLINSARLDLGAIGNDLLGEQAKNVWDAISRITVSDDGSIAFAGASVHLVRKDAALVHRLKLAQVLIRVDGGATLSDLKQESAAGVSASFPASNGLLSGMYLLDVFLRPLLGAMSPAVWGFAAHRTKGSILIGFGTSIAGTSGESAELLQMLTSGSADGPKPHPHIDAADTDGAIYWWSNALDQLMGTVSDPATHCDDAGVYSPTRHLEVMLTVEQLFQRVAAMQGAHRDVATARTLFFAVIDTLAWFTGKSFEDCCNLENASKVLARLENELPRTAANLLLPNARRAVAALADLQIGFFVGSGPTEEEIELVGPHGYRQKVRTESAVAMYVAVLRNAVHGHGAKKHAERSAALLSQHDGDIPADLAQVGYLYFLDLLSRPDFVSRKLSADSRRPNRPPR